MAFRLDRDGTITVKPLHRPAFQHEYALGVERSRDDVKRCILSNAAIEMAQECPSLFLIGSAVRARAILKAIKTLGAGRVCFGSDTPFELMHVEVAKYHALLDGEIMPEEKHQIMGGNVARLVGLEIT